VIGFGKDAVKSVSNGNYRQAAYEGTGVVLNALGAVGTAMNDGMKEDIARKTGKLT
jgi:hypothetical protein